MRQSLCVRTVSNGLRPITPPCLGCGSESSWMLLGVSSEGSREPLGRSFEASWEPLGGLLGLLGGHLGGLLGLLGGFCAAWRVVVRRLPERDGAAELCGGTRSGLWGTAEKHASGGLPGASWGGELELSVCVPPLGPLLGPSWDPPGPSWRPRAVLRASCAVSAPSWGPLA